MIPLSLPHSAHGNSEFNKRDCAPCQEATIKITIFFALDHFWENFEIYSYINIHKISFPVLIPYNPRGHRFYQTYFCTYAVYFCTTYCMCMPESFIEINASLPSHCWKEDFKGIGTWRFWVLCATPNTLSFQWRHNTLRT
jgi:hypothetical protein